MVPCIFSLLVTFMGDQDMSTWTNDDYLLLYCIIYFYIHCSIDTFTIYVYKLKYWVINYRDDHRDEKIDQLIFIT